MKSSSAEALTPREQEVIELLSTGRTNEEIARQLGISLDGVKYHVSGILRRLRVENRHEAASLHLGTAGGVLTPREQEVIELLSTGLTNEEIARQLGISVDGVKYHVSGILRRLDVESRREASALHLATQGSGRFGAWAPVIFLRKLPFAWLPKAAAGAVFTATVAGIALLAWGVLSTSTDAVTTTGCEGAQPAHGAANCARAVAPTGAGADETTAISAGLGHTCALSNGGVWCWGQLTQSDQGGIAPAPYAVPGLESGVSAVSASDLSCALKDGGVWCWWGESLPDHVTGFWSDVRKGPIVVPGLERGVSAISGSCALKGGGVSCWHRITYGGPETGVSFGPPVAVALPGLESGVSAISVRRGIGCALRDGGTWCWGRGGPNLCEQNDACISAPVAVSGLTSGVSAISTSGDHRCALKDGGVWCWGRNGAGQLGNDSTTDSLLPVAVSGLASGVSAISTGGDHSCALRDGGAWCWGSNQYGQLGNNSTTDSAAPVAVAGLASGASAISTGDRHTCALKDGGFLCWGDNRLAELGSSRPGWTDVPVLVSGLASGVGAIEALPGLADSAFAGSTSAVCALKAGGVWCWGSNSNGQLGNNSTSDSPVPVLVSGLGDGVSAISAGPCAQKDNGLWCWGRNFSGGAGPSESHVPVAVPGLASGVGSIKEMCALKDGGIWCDPWTAALPGFESGVRAISEGPLCALKDGGVRCARLDGSVPMLPVLGLDRGVAALSGSCALQDGGAWCWGWRQENEGLADPPVSVSGLESGVSAISYGDFRVCGLKDGGVWCSRDSTAGAVAMPGLESGVSAISGNCALKEGGVWCWGSNSNGQLGNNSPADSYSPVPVAVQFSAPSAGAPGAGTP
jgi:DNA-binding CsgD family transcriptional regulator/alpha-tubulin suppressor-like RCC1 family protein